MDHTDFFNTSGLDRYHAVLARYGRQDLSAKAACEYLAELLRDAANFDDEQSRLIVGAYQLVHDRFDGLPVEDDEFERLLTP